MRLAWFVGALLSGCTAGEGNESARSDSAGGADSGDSGNDTGLTTVGGPGLSLTFHGAPPKNVLVYTVDTLRRDRLPWYDSPHDTLPSLADRAENVVVVDQAFTVGSWTVPSTAAQFSGLDLPRTEMVTGAGGLIDNGATLPAGTVMEMFQASGYATGLITGNGLVSSANGFWQGVDHGEVWLDSVTNSYALATASNSWLASLAADEPFYLHIQPMDVHHPFNGTEFVGTFADPAELPFELGASDQAGRSRIALDALSSDPAAQAALVELIRSTYDDEVLQVDHALAEMLSALEASGRLDDTLVVFTADHGEAIADGATGWWRFGHAKTVRPEVVRIPLAFYNPRLVGGRIDECIVQNVDWMPTVATLAGVPPLTEERDGRDVTEACRPWGVSTTYGWDAATSETSLETAVVYDTVSAVRGTCSHGDYSFAAFDHVADPAEEVPLAITELPQGPKLREHLKAYLEHAAEVWVGAACR